MAWGARIVTLYIKEIKHIIKENNTRKIILHALTRGSFTDS